VPLVCAPSLITNIENTFFLKITIITHDWHMYNRIKV
jgi:hypothetical protein